MRPSKSNDISRVRAVLTLLEAGLRTMPVYGPGHPTYEQVMEKVGMGFRELWEPDDVLPVDDDHEGLAWALSEAGIRFIAFSPGVEEEEQEILRSHTWLGALSAYRFRDYGEIPYRGMITAYEHHEDGFFTVPQGHTIEKALRVFQDRGTGRGVRCRDEYV